MSETVTGVENFAFWMAVAIAIAGGIMLTLATLKVFGLI